MHILVLKHTMLSDEVLGSNIGAKCGARTKLQPDSVPGQDELLQLYLVLQAIGHFGEWGPNLAAKFHPRIK